MTHKPRLSPLEILHLTPFSLLHLQVWPRQSEPTLVTSVRRGPINMVSKRKFQSGAQVDNTEELNVPRHPGSGEDPGLTPWGPGAGGRPHRDSGPGEGDLQPLPRPGGSA